MKWRLNLYFLRGTSLSKLTIAQHCLLPLAQSVYPNDVEKWCKYCCCCCCCVWRDLKVKITFWDWFLLSIYKEIAKIFEACLTDPFLSRDLFLYSAHVLRRGKLPKSFVFPCAHTITSEIISSRNAERCSECSSALLYRKIPVETNQLYTITSETPSMIVLQTLISDNVTNLFITLTGPCSEHLPPPKLHFIQEKRGFAGVYIILLIFAQNIDRWGKSNKHRQSMFRP